MIDSLELAQNALEIIVTNKDVKYLTNTEWIFTEPYIDGGIEKYDLSIEQIQRATTFLIKYEDDRYMIMHHNNIEIEKLCGILMLKMSSQLNGEFKNANHLVKEAESALNELTAIKNNDVYSVQFSLMTASGKQKFIFRDKIIYGRKHMIGYIDRYINFACKFELTYSEIIGIDLQNKKYHDGDVDKACMYVFINKSRFYASKDGLSQKELDWLNMDYLGRKDYSQREKLIKQGNLHVWESVIQNGKLVINLDHDHCKSLGHNGAICVNCGYKYCIDCNENIPVCKA